MPVDTRKGSLKGGEAENELIPLMTELIQGGMNELKSSLQSFKDEMHKEMTSVIKTAVNDAIQKELSSLRSEIEEQKREMEQMKKFLVESENQKLKEKRRELSCNVIINGLAEEEDEDDDDTLEKVTVLLHKAIPDAEVEKAFRLGKRKNTPRVVKVIFDSKETRNQVLTEVRKHKDTFFKDIYVNADRPFADRQESFRLRKKLKTLKKQNPHQNLYIRRGKLYFDNIAIDEEQPLQQIFHSS